MKVVAAALFAILFPVQATPPPDIFPSTGPYALNDAGDAARAISHHVRISGAFALDLIGAVGRADLTDCLAGRPEAPVDIGETSTPNIIDRNARGCSLAGKGPQPAGPRPFVTSSRREVAALALAFNRWNLAPFFRRNDRDLRKYDVGLEYRGPLIAVIFGPIRALLGANAEVVGCPNTGIAPAIFLFDRATLEERPTHYAC